MKYSLLRSIGVLLLAAQLFAASAPVCAFACAVDSSEAVTAQSNAPTQDEHDGCSCGMQALCHIAYAPVLLSQAQLLSQADVAGAPANTPVLLLTRYIAPLPEPPVA